MAEILTAHFCQGCFHPVIGHHDDNGHVKFICHERLSPENNDFCGCTLAAPEVAPVVFYAIRNKMGLWYRTYAKNRSAGWVKDLGDARIYTKVTPARSKITALANEARGLTPPVLIEIVVGKMIVIDQMERIEDARKRKLQEQARKHAWTKEAQLMRAQKEFNEAQARLAKLTGG